MHVRHCWLTCLLALLALDVHAQQLPLKEAARDGDLSRVVVLLNSGTPLEAADEGQNTALISAAYHGHAEVVGELLKRGAIADHRNTDGYAGLDYAMERGHRDVVLAFLRHWHAAALDSKQDMQALGLEAMMQVSEPGSAGVLPAGLRPDEPNSSGYGPLAMACRWGATEFVKQLLAMGANPAIASASRYNSTPLMEATRDGRVDVATLLVAAGADVNQRDKHGDHALNWAAFFGDPAMVQFLVDHGSRLDFTGQSPETALQIATREGHAEAVKILQAAALSNPAK